MNKFKITAIVLSVLSFQAAAFDGNAAYEYGKALGLEVRARAAIFWRTSPAASAFLFKAILESELNMNITRRKMIKLMAASVPAFQVAQALGQEAIPGATVPEKPTRDVPMRGLGISFTVPPDLNTITDREKIVSSMTKVDGVSTNFTWTFAPFSASVLVLNTKE